MRDLSSLQCCLFVGKQKRNMEIFYHLKSFYSLSNSQNYSPGNISVSVNLELLLGNFFCLLCVSSGFLQLSCTVNVIISISVQLLICTWKTFLQLFLKDHLSNFSYIIFEIESLVKHNPLYY